MRIRLALLVLAACLAGYSQTVVAYDPGASTGLTSSGKYTVSVNGTNIPVMTYGNDYGTSPQRKHWAWFAFGGGTVTVDVTYNPATITSYTASPKRNPVSVTQPSAKVLRYSLSSPRYIVLQKINGDSEALILFADPLESSPPTASSGVRYNGTTYCSNTTGASDSASCLQSAINAANTAGGGTVTVSAGKFRYDSMVTVKPNVNLYMAPGSMLFMPTGTPTGYSGQVSLVVESGSSITGRGVIYGNGGNSFGDRGQNMMYTHGTGINIADVMLLDSRTTGLRLVGATQTIDHVKIMTLSREVSDGIDLAGANNITIRDGFIISTDDNISFGYGDNAFLDTSYLTHTVNVSRMVFWHMQTGADFKIVPCYNIDTHHITIDDSDMIASDTLMALYAHGAITIRDVTISNMRIEETRIKPFEFLIPDATGWAYGGTALGPCETSPTGSLHDVTISNVTIDSPIGAQQSLVRGADSSHKISNINFNNVRVGGGLATNAASANMYVDGATTSNITFTSGSTLSPVTLLLATPASFTQAAGSNISVTTNWSGGPTAASQTIFTHFVDSAGAIAFYDNHLPSTLSSSWSGTYQDVGPSVAIPGGATGTYKIMAGLFDAATGNRLTLTAGAGVTPNGDDRYQVGSLTIASAGSTGGSVISGRVAVGGRISIQ